MATPTVGVKQIPRGRLHKQGPGQADLVARALRRLAGTGLLTQEDIGPIIAGAGVLVWHKVTKTYADFAFAGNSHTIAVYTLPAATVIHAIKLKHSTSFSGGAITGYTLEAFYNSVDTGPFNVHQAVTPIAMTASEGIGLASQDGSGLLNDVACTAVASGAGVTLLNSATQGVVDIWMLTSVAA